MFGNIRKKLNNVIQEGLTTTNLKVSQTGNFDVTKTDLGIPSDINLSAGCQFLQKKEDLWKEIHEANEINATKASNVDASITRIRIKTEKLYVDMTDLNVSLVDIPKIKNNLQECNELITSVANLCTDCETKLLELEDIIEEIEFQDKKIEHKYQLSMYKRKKINELEKVRQKLSAQHQENIKQYENQIRKVQQERQAVFQDAFQHDMEIFKEKGSIPKVEHKNKILETVVLLEEIDLDDSKTNVDLENFLNE